MRQDVRPSADWLTVAVVALTLTGVGAPVAGLLVAARVASAAVRVAKVVVDVARAGQIVVRASRYTRGVSAVREMTASSRAAEWAGRVWSQGSRATVRPSSHGTPMRTGPSGRWVSGPGVGREGAPKMNFGRIHVRQNFHVWLR